MRHRQARRRLSQKPAHARLILCNLLTSLILYEAVRTTRDRARCVQPLLDRLLTRIRGRPAYLAIRVLNQHLADPLASRKVMEVLLPRYAKRLSGLSRITNLGYRQGDGAKMVELLLLDSPLP